MNPDDLRRMAPVCPTLLLSTEALGLCVCTCVFVHVEEASVCSVASSVVLSLAF